MKHFLDIKDLSKADIIKIIDVAKDLKINSKKIDARPLDGKHLAMIFEKPSTRTRVSFEVGINQLGGSAVTLDSSNSQIGRGEEAKDSARVLSRYVDMIMIRCFKHQTLIDYAKYATVPVINGLTDQSHPCQIIADLLTFNENKGDIKNKKVVWFGDVNNMTQSWAELANILDFKFVISCPEILQDKSLKSDNVSYAFKACEAANNADLIMTDTWFSMGDEDTDNKRKILADYQVNKNLIAKARNDTMFLHCLPAHRGEEVTDSVIDGDNSYVIDEAENRLHAQKSIMLWVKDKI